MCCITVVDPCPCCWELLRESSPAKKNNIKAVLLERLPAQKDGGCLAEDRTTGLSEGQMDPIQKLFLDSIREYSTKSQAAGGLVDAGSDYEKALAEEVAKLQRLYGGGDLASFPQFTFTEPKLDEVAQK
uniref:ATP synthase peripheral stalk subunit F6, mitochondrial n=1 Tax=Gasterosteus aculeatus aculeatus TaxID=481459 RepID=G3N992_GASAC